MTMAISASFQGLQSLPPMTIITLNPGKRIIREYGHSFVIVHEHASPPAEPGCYVCQIYKQIIDRRGIPVNIVEDFHPVEESIFDMESLRQARLGTWIGIQVLLETCSPFLSDEEKLALASGTFGKKLHDSVFNLCLAQLVMLSNQPII